MLLHTDAFTHKHFYTQRLLHTYAFAQTLSHAETLHTDDFSHRYFYTQTLLHRRFYRNTFTRRDFYTQKLLHTEAFTLLHADAFTHRRFYTNTFTRRDFYTQTLLHTDTFYTQKLDTDAFTHRHFHTQTLLHTNTFTHRDRTVKSQFYFSFSRSNIISCERVATGTRKSQFYLQFLAIEHHFVRKGCDGNPEIAILPAVFGDRTSFRAKGFAGRVATCNFTCSF